MSLVTGRNTHDPRVLQTDAYSLQPGNPNRVWRCIGNVPGGNETRYGFEDVTQPFEADWYPASHPFVRRLKFIRRIPFKP